LHYQYPNLTKPDDPICNLDFSEWGDAFPGNRIVGAATLDRPRHGTYRIILDGDSFRTPKPMPEIDQNRLAKSSKKPPS
jgi:DNA replication protein DnaC